MKAIWRQKTFRWQDIHALQGKPCPDGGGGILGQTYHKPRHLSHQFFSASFCLCSSVSSQSALQSARFCFFHFWLQKPCNSLAALHLYRHRHQSLRAFWCRMHKLRKATWYKHFTLKSFWTFIGHCLQNTGVCSVFFKCTVNSGMFLHSITCSFRSDQPKTTTYGSMLEFFVGLWSTNRLFASIFSCYQAQLAQPMEHLKYHIFGWVFTVDWCLSAHCWFVLAVFFHCDNEMGGNPKNSKIL